MSADDLELAGWDAKRVARVLGAWPLCQANPGLRDALLARGKFVRFDAGAVVIEQGAEDRTVFFLLRGDVDIRVHGHLVAVRPAGQHVGEMAAINPKAARSATVTARETVFALSLEGDDIDVIGEAHPVLWRSFASELADRLAQRGRVVEQLLPAPPGPLLGPVTVQRVQDVINGLDPRPELRRVLLAGIDPGFVLTLPGAAGPQGGPLSDLRHMTRAGILATGLVPLRAWLLNALALLSSEARAPVQDALRELEMTLAARSGRPAPPQLERIIHRDDMLPFEFAEGMVAVGKAVAHLTCRVVRDGCEGPQSFGTGWLVTPELLVTAAHVVRCCDPAEDLPAADLDRQVASLEARFEFHAPMQLGPACSIVTLVASCRSLDYALLRLDRPLPIRPLRLASRPLRISSAVPLPLNVIQHPLGGPKKLGIRNNLIADWSESRIRYFTDTEAGSSGAPVLNDRWEVVAVHTCWDTAEPCLEFHGQRTAWVNRGTRIDRILEDLRDRFPAVADEIERSWGQVSDQPKPA